MRMILDEAPMDFDRMFWWSEEIFLVKEMNPSELVPPAGHLSSFREDLLHLFVALNSQDTWFHTLDFDPIDNMNILLQTICLYWM